MTPTRRLLLPAVLALLAGCTPHRTYFVERRAVPYWKTVGKPVPYPLARTLTWKYQMYAERSDVSEPSKQFGFVADGKHVSAKDGKRMVKNGTMFATQPVTSGVHTSDVYAERARDAERSGQGVMAAHYRSQSEVSLQNEISTGRMSATLALGGAIVALGDSLVVAFFAFDTMHYARTTEQFLKTAPVAAVIGDAAPEGSVLELFLYVDRRYRGLNPLYEKRTYTAIATLRDGDGKIWRSMVAFDGTMVQSTKGPLVPKDLAAEQQYLDPKLAIPWGAPPTEYQADVVHLEAIHRKRGMAALAVAASAAIHGLYEQIEAAKQPVPLPVPEPAPMPPPGPAS